MYLSKVDYEIYFYIFAHKIFENNNIIVSICFVFMRQACGVMCHVNIIRTCTKKPFIFMAKLHITSFKFGQDSIQFYKFWPFQFSPISFICFQFKISIQIRFTVTISYQFKWIFFFSLTKWMVKTNTQTRSNKNTPN